MGDDQDLDNLIADSLGGIESALEGEKKSAASAAQASAAGDKGLGDALKELQKEVPKDTARSEDGPVNEEFFCHLAKTFQDPVFQKTMQELMHGDGSEVGASASSASPAGGSESANGSASTSPRGTEDFLANFVKSFEAAVENDEGFGKQMESLMTGMLSKDILREPLQQISDALGPWLAQNRGTLSAVEVDRYENQLRLYSRILSIYNSCPDPIPEDAKMELQRLLTELQQYGSAPPEVMAKVVPQDASGEEESFEDFVRQMSLADGLSGTEQDLLKKLSQDPSELTKAMQEMTAEMQNNQDCKQQ